MRAAHFTARSVRTVNAVGKAPPFNPRAWQWLLVPLKVEEFRAEGGRHSGRPLL